MIGNAHIKTLRTRVWRSLPQSRAEAEQLGEDWYYSARCRNGHAGLGSVRFGCVVCTGLATANYTIRKAEARALEDTGIETSAQSVERKDV
jgi:hypothetical protein